MKKTFTLSVICLLITAFSASAQKSVLFKIKYKPKHNYAYDILSDVNMLMTFKGDSLTLDSMKAKGAPGAMNMVMQNKMQMNVLTDGAKKDGTFPVTMSLEKVSSKASMNGKEMTLPGNTGAAQTFSGVGKADGKLRIDSVHIAGVDAATKKSLIDMMNTMQEQVKFPEKPLHIGESFTQDIPMNMPIAGTVMNVTVKSVYKLISIKADAAFFDIDQSAIFNTEIQGKKMTMQGKGTGKMEYSIKNSFISNMTGDLALNYLMDLGKIQMAGEAKTVTNLKTVITATK